MAEGSNTAPAKLSQLGDGSHSALLDVFTIAAHYRLLPKEGWSLTRALAAVRPPLRVRLRVEFVPRALAASILAFPTIVDLHLLGPFSGPPFMLPLKLLRRLQLSRFEDQLPLLPPSLRELGLHSYSVAEGTTAVLELPAELRSLVVTVLPATGWGGRGVLDLGVLPPSLTDLAVTDYSATVCIGPLPDTLQTLHLSLYEQRMLEHGSLPPGLRSLKLSSLPTSPVHELVPREHARTLPPLPLSLRHLEVGNLAYPPRTLPGGLLFLEWRCVDWLDASRAALGLPSVQLPPLPRSLRELHLPDWDFGGDFLLPDALEVLVLRVPKEGLAEHPRLPVLPASLLKLSCWCWVRGSVPQGAPALQLQALPLRLREAQLNGVQLRSAVPASVHILHTGCWFDEAGLVFEGGRQPEIWRRQQPDPTPFSL